MNSIIRASALLVATVGILAPTLASAADMGEIQAGLGRAQARLAVKDVAGTQGELTSISNQLAKDSTADSKGVLQQVQFVTATLQSGDLKDAAGDLANL